MAKIAVPKNEVPTDVTIQRDWKTDTVKIRFSLDGKRYKMLMQAEVLDELETKPADLIKELKLV